MRILLMRHFLATILEDLRLESLKDSDEYPETIFKRTGGILKILLIKSRW